MDRRVSGDITCGIGNFRPPWMRKLANPKVFMINFSLIAIVQGAYFAYLIGNTSTLEKRFAYSSQLTGFILIADNLSQLVINPVIGYLGTRVNKAKLMACGMIFISFSCWMTGIPYLIYGRNTLGESLLRINETRRLDETTQYCKTTIGEQCIAGSSSDHSTVWPAFIIIFMASFLNGIGHCAFYTLGVPYIDDNVSKRNAPVYFSAIACIRLLGPASGFMLSSFCLNMYEDPFHDPGFGRKDPRWIGAWWLGFFIIGTLIFLTSLPLFLFPKHLKSRRAAKKVEASPESTTKDVISSLKRFATNKVLVYDTISRAFGWIGMGGYYISQPKYIESQYGTSAAKASLFTGTTTTIALAVGIMSGGVIVRIFKPGPRVLTTYMFIVGLFTTIGLISGLFLGCDRRSFYEETSDLSSVNLFSSTCNSECSCSQHVFQPVCGSDQVTNYFSPCAAGCHQPTLTIRENNETALTGFQDCSCEDGREVTSGYCKSDCGNNLQSYITIVSIGKLIASTAFTGNILVRLRCVDDRDKSFAIGITKTILALGASIPYPLLFGAITDSTCLIWESSPCGKKGNCWFYDSDKMRNYLHISSVTFLLLASLFDLFVIYYAHEIKNFYEEDEEKDQQMESKAKLDTKGSPDTKKKIKRTPETTIEEMDDETREKFYDKTQL